MRVGLQALVKAGYSMVFLSKYRTSVCFVLANIEVRPGECSPAVLITACSAWKPASAAAGALDARLWHVRSVGRRSLR